MNYDRKKQEQLLYEQSTQHGYSEEYIRQANMQSDNIELEKMGGRTIPLEKDYKYQMIIIFLLQSYWEWLSDLVGRHVLIQY